MSPAPAVNLGGPGGSRWGLVGPGGRLGLRAGRGRVGGGPGGVAGRMGRVGLVGGGVAGRVGWYGPAAVNVYTARKGVCNGGVKNAL